MVEINVDILWKKWMFGWAGMTVGFLHFLLSLVIGGVIAWIVHAVVCVMKKRKNKVADS